MSKKEDRLTESYNAEEKLNHNIKHIKQYRNANMHNHRLLRRFTDLVEARIAAGFLVRDGFVTALVVVLLGNARGEDWRPKERRRRAGVTRRRHAFLATKYKELFTRDFAGGEVVQLASELEVGVGGDEKPVGGVSRGGEDGEVRGHHCSDDGNGESNGVTGEVGSGGSG